MRDLVFLLNEFSAKQLNSMTKYPSIQTYHEIDRGALKKELTDGVSFGDEEVHVSEKVDGTNGRILVLNGDYIIGSREELLYRKGDVFGNPSQGIVDIMKDYAEHISFLLPKDDKLYVFYGEVYGSNINGAKQYTRHGAADVRFFDCWVSEDYMERLEYSVESLSSWREHGGQPFLSIAERDELFKEVVVAPVPERVICSGKDIPVDRAGAYEWLKQFESTCAAMDKYMPDGSPFKGRAEGVVIRTMDRRVIRKLRFEDYEKTIKREGKL